MKTRTGFVSNSSSSSFIIKKSDLSRSEINCLYNHMDIVKNMKYKDDFDSYSDFSCNSENEWFICEDDDYIKGSTSMDNFDMRSFMSLMGIDQDKAEWNES